MEMSKPDTYNLPGRTWSSDQKRIEAEHKRILQFLENKLSGKRAVVGLSGGVDSSVTAFLTAEAIGGMDKVLGLIMPTGFTPKQDLEDAHWVANILQINSVEIPIDPIVDAYATAFRFSGRVKAGNMRQQVSMGNLRARIRMTLLYYFANLESRIVVGTGDRSEALIGYFTKYGDGGVDLLPIGHLYKTEVRALGRLLGVKLSIIEKPSSPQLWSGHQATQEIPADYDVLDHALSALYDEGGIADSDVKTRASNMHTSSIHKREMPASLVR